MRLLVKVIVGVSVLGIVGWFAIPPLLAYWQAQHKPEFRQAAVTRGEIISVVNSTGTVQPVLNVQVGSLSPDRFVRSTWTSMPRSRKNKCWRRSIR